MMDVEDSDNKYEKNEEMQLGQLSSTDDEDDSDDDLPNLKGRRDSPFKNVNREFDVFALDEQERSYQNRKKILEEITKEIELFDLKEGETEELPTPDLEPARELVIQPPGVNFFTPGNFYIYYTQDTLVWPFKSNHDAFLSSLSAPQIREYILAERFQKQFMSRTQAIYIWSYLFHLMCTATDQELLNATVKTINYITLNNNIAIRKAIKQELTLALLNLGADLNRLGVKKEETENDMVFISAVVPAEENKRENGLSLFPRQNITKLLEFLVLLFSNSEVGSIIDDHLDACVMMVCSVALDPLMLDSGADYLIYNCMGHILRLYGPYQKFKERIPALAEKIGTYCEFESHTVAHLCQYYLPVTTEGSLLSAAVAFIQVQIILTVPQEVVIDVVEISDVWELIELRYEELEAEQDFYILLQLIKLLDVCIGTRPCPIRLRDSLKRLCMALLPVIESKRDKVTDLNSTIFRSIAPVILSKWEHKADVADGAQKESVCGFSV